MASHESRALAPTLQAGNRPAGIVPTSFDDCYRLAQLLAQSSMVPPAFKGKPEDCCVAIMQGLEVGLSPLAALTSIAVINGRPSLWGDGALAVVQASGLVDSFEETDDGETATCRVKRRGSPHLIVRTFSMTDAKQAQLAGKTGPWSQYPRRMRQMRARSWALRDGFSDVLRGLYVAEEAEDATPQMRDITPPPDIPDVAPVAAPAAAQAPDVPDDPPAASDADFLAGLDAALGHCRAEADIARLADANRAEVEERAVEQAASDLVEKHRARLAAAQAKPDAKAQEHDYKRIVLAMRGCQQITPPAAAFAALKGLVEHEWALIGAMPERWQNELRAEKDRVLARIKEQREGAAA